MCNVNELQCTIPVNLSDIFNIFCKPSYDVQRVPSHICFNCDSGKPPLFQNLTNCLRNVQTLYPVNFCDGESLWRIFRISQDSGANFCCIAIYTQ